MSENLSVIETSISEYVGYFDKVSKIVQKAFKINKIMMSQTEIGLIFDGPYNDVDLNNIQFLSRTPSKEEEKGYEKNRMKASGLIAPNDKVLLKD